MVDGIAGAFEKRGNAGLDIYPAILNELKSTFASWLYRCFDPHQIAHDALSELFRFRLCLGC